MNQIISPREIEAKINELNNKIEIRRSACQQIHNKLKETKITSGELANNANYLVSYDMYCSLCDTPGNYLQHIWGCLKSKEEVENWKNDVLHFIQQRKEDLIREGGRTITEQEFQDWEAKADKFAKDWEEWYLKKIEEEKKVFASSVGKLWKCSQCNGLFPIKNGHLYSYGFKNKSFCSPECVVEYYGQEARDAYFPSVTNFSPNFSSELTELSLCSLCKNNPARIKYIGQDEWYCSFECADRKLLKCEECNNSSIHYTDGKKIDHCSIDGKKLCFSCFEIRVKEKYNPPSTNDEQETSPTFSVPNYSADNYHPSPKVKFDQHDQHQEKEPQTTQQRSPSISNSELDLHKKILQKEIENLLENNPQIKLEENWKEELNRLNDFSSINEFAKQTKSAILAKIQKAKQEQINSEEANPYNQEENIKNKSNLAPLIITSIAIIGSVIFVASLIFIRKNKLKAK